jgi:hypothetical protein
MVPQPGVPEQRRVVLTAEVMVNGVVVYVERKGRPLMVGDTAAFFGSVGAVEEGLGIGTEPL